MLRTCTYLLVLFTFYSFYVGDNLSEAAPTEPPKEQVTTTNNDGFSDPEIAGIIVGVIIPIIGSSIVAIIAVIGCYLSRKVLVATIEEKNDGSLGCEVKIGEKRVVNHVTYKWYKLNLQDTQQPQRDLISTSNNLPQQKSVFDSQQTYQCEVKYTAIRKNFCCRIRKATSNTLTVGKKYITATIDECTDGKLICNVEKDNKKIDDILTYQWYDGESELEGETEKKLTKEVSHDSKLRYRCEVKYSALATNVTVMASCIIATIDECDDGTFICNVEKGNECINNGLTYQWYDGERELEGEIGKQLAQNPVPHDSIQQYRCKVKFTAPTYVVNLTAINGIIATIDECDDGKFICNVEKGSERINDGLTYQWYDGERELVGETGKQLSQNPVPHDSIQQYRCEVKFTAPTYVVNVTAIKSGTLEKNISATIDECDDGKLICNVEKTILTYQWYDGERRLEGETGKQLAQNSVSFESVQKYRCEVKYTASNWDPDVFVEQTSDTLTRFCYRAALQQSYRELKPCDMRYLCLIDIMQTFMELKYIEECDDEKPNLERRTKTFEELKQTVFQNQSLTILITGDPGSGKTTSINRLAYESAVNPDLKGNILILVRLADLNDIDKDQCTLQTIIRKAIPLLDCTDKYADEPKHIETEITNNRCSGKYIFALDGYDEYKKSKEQNFITRLIKREVLKNCTVVISSRPSSCKDFSNDFKRFKIAQFDNIEKFIEHHYVDKVKRNSKCEDSAVREAEDNAEKLIEFVKKHKFLPSLCSLPLHCAMVCLYFDINPPKTLSTPPETMTESNTSPETITELYIFFVAITIKRHCETRNFEMPKQFHSGEEIDKQVKILKQVHINSEMLKPVCQVCRYAYNQVTGSDESIEFDEQSGLGLVTVQLMKPYDEKVYRFFHTTIMEYLAALHMVLSEKDWDLISKTKISEENLLEVWKFLCGLTKDVDIFKNIVSTQSTRNSYPIQCAHETQRKEAVEHVLRKFVHGDMFSCGCMLNPFDCAAIFQVLEPSQLTCLDLKYCQIGPEGARLLKGGLEKCSKLIQLSLGGNGIGDKGAEHISDAIKKLSTLTHLDLAYNGIGDKGAEHLSDAIKILSTLTHLDLNGCRIGPEGARLLKGGLEKCSKLETLRLRGNGIGDKGAEHISDAINKLSTLTHLDLQLNNIGHEGAKHLSVAIKDSPSLMTLSVSFNKIGVEGAEHISVAIKESSSLKKLYLGSNNIGDKGAEHISVAIKKSSSLEVLDLDNNSIGDEGAKHLSVAIKELSSLEVLALFRNRIGEKGKGFLMTAKESIKIILDHQYH